MKPNIVTEEVPVQFEKQVLDETGNVVDKKTVTKIRKVETWYLGQGSEIHNSVGCQHYFIQVEGTKVECNKCGLGLFGHAENGLLQK